MKDRAAGLTENPAAAGASPAGAKDEASAARAVQSMFDRIAARYDLLNHILSLGIDTVWRRRVASTFRDVLARPESCILDLCCGTGDLAIALSKFRPENARPIVAADFSQEMLLLARRKFSGRNIVALEADAMHLPLPDASIDLIVAGFGFRNLVNYREALRELNRVLAPGGRLGILEAAEPDGLIGGLYRIYFHRILPVIGKVISGDAGAYRYLPASVEKFPEPAALLQMMRDTDFSNMEWTRYTFGVAGLFRANKAQLQPGESL